MEQQSLRSVSDGRLLRLTLARPGKRNALNLALCRALAEAVENADPGEVGCILLDAEGPSFCAGMDLGESTTVDADDLAVAHERLFSLNRRAKVPIVAAVQGHAIAGGTGLAAQAHLIVADQTAQFGLTEVRVGMWPMLVYRSVEEAIGPRKTLEWSLTGRTVDAAEAQAAGLVHALGTAEQAEQMAQEIASRSPEAIRYGMRYYSESRGLSFADAGRLAANLRKNLMSSAPYVEIAKEFQRSKTKHD